MKTGLSELIPDEDRDCEMPFVHLFEMMDPSEQLWIRSRCSKPWCLTCEPAKVWRLQVKIRKYLDYHDCTHYWLITRSVRNEPEIFTAFNTFNDARQKFVKQVRDHKDHPYRVAEKWISTTEITHSLDTGFNVHEHIIWGSNSRFRIDFALLHKYWDRAAGFKGAHINVSRLADAEHGANYIAKYFKKEGLVWGGLSSGRAYLNRGVLKGKNRIQSKRGTLPPQMHGDYCFCCLVGFAKDCNGYGEEPYYGEGAF